MKRTVGILIFLFCFFLGQNSFAQNLPNWTKDQLMEPADLVKLLSSGKLVPYLFSVGPGALIPTSIAIGMTNEKANLESLKKQVSSLPKNSQVILYCGCCPFENCPNVRPAIDALKQLQFTNYKLLNIPHNLKTDWIDKGYPTIKQ